MITARYANEFGRDIYALPNSPDVLQAKGCLTLIHNGAEIIIEQEQLLANLGAIPTLEPTQQLSLLHVTEAETLPDLDPISLKIFKALNHESIGFDSIIQITELSASEVSGKLLGLELMGLVKQLPGMRYQRS